MSPAPIENAAVEAVFASYPEPVRAGLLKLRGLILETAEATDGVGTIEETLKWGQPSYLTGETSSGSTIRIAPADAKSGFDYAMYFICSTSLVSAFESLSSDVFSYEGERALLFSVGDEVPVDELRQCVRMTLTYHKVKLDPVGVYG
jgi:hypothetical protein